MFDSVDLSTKMTHSESAWLLHAVPMALTVAALLVIVFLLRDRMMELLIAANVRRANENRKTLPAGQVPDAALYWTPPAVPPGLFLASCGGASILVLIIMSLMVPMFVALVVSIPVTASLVWLFSRIYEARYVGQIDKDLTAAVGRMSAMLRSGNSFRQTMDKLVKDMPQGPLRSEWSFLLERQGVPLTDREGIATPQQVAAALAAQTPSRRHATFMDHMAVAVGQPQDVLVTRVSTAYEALQNSDRRREEAVTELAQMRYSGLAVGLAGLVMACYLFWTQWDRVVVAYSSTLGMIVAAFVGASLMLPVAGGVLLARAEDIDY
jgi:hypothetical protein